MAVIGVIGRFVEQKGFHLLAQTIESLIQNMHVQLVILGTGIKILRISLETFQSATVEKSALISASITIEHT